MQDVGIITVVYRVRL